MHCRLASTRFLLFVSISFIFLVPSVALAVEAQVWASDATGAVKNSFYTNDTVYITGVNLTADTSATVRVYITENSDKWANGTVLTAVGTGYQEFTTNGTGDLPPTALWPNPSVGNYDVVVDTGQDGVYNSSKDFVDNLTTVGFTVSAPPAPVLYVSVGENSSSDHDWNLTEETGGNVMLQLKLRTSNLEPVTVNSLSLLASGTGDDENGIKYVQVVLDVDRDGVYDVGESRLAYGNYLKDNGVLNLVLTGKNQIPANSTRYFLILYMISESASVGDTFKFDILSIDAVGSSGQKAVVDGLYITSATKTITGAAPTTTTTTTTTTVPNATTTTLATTTVPTTPQTTTTTAAPAGGEMDYSLIIALIAAVAGGAVVVYVLWKRRSRYAYSFEELQKKYEKEQ